MVVTILETLVRSARQAVHGKMCTLAIKWVSKGLFITFISQELDEKYSLLMQDVLSIVHGFILTKKINVKGLTKQNMFKKNHFKDL